MSLPRRCSAALLVALVFAACGSTPVPTPPPATTTPTSASQPVGPSPATAPTPTASTAPAATSPAATGSPTEADATIPDVIGGFSVARPVAWSIWSATRSVPFTGGPLAYLASQPLDPNCAASSRQPGNPAPSGGPSCRWPLASLAPNGVLVTMYTTRLLIPRHQEGDVLNVLGTSTRMTVDVPGLCGAIGAVETLDILLPQNGGSADVSNLGMQVCIAGPDVTAEERRVRTFLTSIGDALSARPGPYFTHVAAEEWIATSGPSGVTVRIPKGQQPLDVGWHALTMIPTQSAGTTVYARGLDAGTGVTTFAFREHLATAVQTQSHAWLAGSGADWTSDSGVIGINFAGNLVSTMVAPGPWPVWFGGSGTRNALRISATGRTVVSQACGPVPAIRHCFVDVLDTVAGTSRRLTLDTQAIPRVTSDALMVAVPDDRSSIAAYDLGDGHRVWSHGDVDFGDGYLVSDGTALIALVSRTPPSGSGVEVALLRIAMDTGREQELWSAPAGDGFSLWPQLSTDATAVIGHGGRLEEAFLHSAIPTADTIDTRTGTRRADQIVLHLP